MPEAAGVTAKPCPKCAEQIHASAKLCRFCNADLRNWFVRHKLLTAFGGFVLVGMIAGRNSGSGGSANLNVPSSAPTHIAAQLTARPSISQPSGPPAASVTKPAAASTNVTTPAPVALSSPAAVSAIPIAAARPIDTPAVIEQPQSAPAAVEEHRRTHLAGNGDSVTREFALASGLAIFNMRATDAHGNVAITLLGADGQNIDLLVNTIGGYSGSQVISIDESAQYVLKVDAEGSAWTVDIDQPQDPQAVSAPLTLRGTHDTATGFVFLDKGLARFALHSDSSHDNFSVWLYAADGENMGLLANTIGSYDGSTAVAIESAGAYILNVTAGEKMNWAITIN